MNVLDTYVNTPPKMEDYSTLEAFRPHFEALAKVGYFKIVLETVSHAKNILHKFYRIFVWMFVICYNLQHVIRVVQVRHSVEQMVDTLFILLTTINTLGKQVALNLRSHRIDGLIDVINGSSFTPTKPQHVIVMKQNASMMSKLLKLYQVAAVTCAGVMTIIHIVHKAIGVTVKFTGYIPWDTTTSPNFEIALVYMAFCLMMQAYGNVTLDCTIVAFYVQAKVQIQVLKYNLEHLTDTDDERVNIDANEIRTNNKYIWYKDDLNNKTKAIIQNRFEKCVEHYLQIVRYCKEVESIFGEAMVIQFFVMAWVICMTVYKMVGLYIFSVECLSMVLYLGCMIAQLFIYCYYGTQLISESDIINESIYTADWLSLSPGFRRQLLIMMECCTRPLTPLVAYVIPMSLETYISILKASYTLFTFLNRKS